MRYLFFLFFSAQVLSQNFQWNNCNLNVSSSFRGLSIVDDSIIFVSGSKGTFGKSLNGGKTWDFSKVSRWDSTDFRSIYAFDKNKIVIANTGSPAVILITTDAGITWKEVYRNSNAVAFFDGIDFWNEQDGIAFGDPIDGKILILKTNDGGNTWTEIKNSPTMSTGEAAYAASGTTIRCIDKSKVIIATGGTASRLLISDDKGLTWKVIETPIIQGAAMQGIFSFAWKSPTQAIIVGGDYEAKTQTNHMFLYRPTTKYKEQQWISPIKTTNGCKGSVEYITDKILFVASNDAVDISYDEGKNWEQFVAEKNIYAIKKARKGKLVVACGKGKIAIVE